MANKGDKFAYGHVDGLGFGEGVKADAGYGELSAEMQELDMQDGQEVTLLEYDADNGWPHVEWVDATGVNRITTIEPAYFEEHFQPTSEA